MRTLIAGCGDLGQRLGLRLVAKGQKVWGLRRNPDGLPEVIQPLAADLSRPETLIQLPPIDQLVVAVSADSFTPQAYTSAYVTGLGNLLAHLPDGVQRLLLVSSSSVFSQQQGEWVTESSPAQGEAFSVQTLLAAEQLALNSGIAQVTCLRLSGIYGPGRLYLLRQLQSGILPCSPGVFSNRIHVDDAASAIDHLLSLSQPPSLVIGTDNQPSDSCEVAHWLAQQLDINPGRLTAAIPSPASRLLRSNKRLSNALLRSTGWQPSYPSYREGYGELLKTL